MDVQPYAPGQGPGATGASGGNTDLPCDVQSVLESNCTSCHGDPPSSAAPMSLVTYADLTAPSQLGGSIAQRAYLRMTATTSPMPPGVPGQVSAADVATYKAWLDAGTPPGSCTPDPLGAAPVCTSGVFYQGDEGPRMRPGDACIQCHSQSREGPRFTIAGTLYPTGHEPADCEGTAGPAQIVITDAHGAVLTLMPNSVGNFSSNATVAFPIHAKVVAGGTERAMVGAQTSGDCNVCHTPNGASMAPGRITMP